MGAGWPDVSPARRGDDGPDSDIDLLVVLSEIKGRRHGAAVAIRCDLRDFPRLWTSWSPPIGGSRRRAICRARSVRRYEKGG